MFAIYKIFHISPESGRDLEQFEVYMLLHHLFPLRLEPSQLLILSRNVIRYAPLSHLRNFLGRIDK